MFVSLYQGIFIFQRRFDFPFTLQYDETLGSRSLSCLDCICYSIAILEITSYQGMIIPSILGHTFLIND